MSILSKTGALTVAISFTLALMTPAFAEDLTATQPAKPALKRPALAPKPIASREAALKAKLEKFKDKRKAALAEKINTNLNTINQNHTNQMAKNLEAMSVILNKLESRVNQGRPDIKNPTAAGSSIAFARLAIGSASAAISAQSENDYTVTVTSELRIKADVKAQRDKLHADLTSVRKMVVGAKQAVADAIRTAKSGKAQVPASEEGTSSGQQ